MANPQQQAGAAPEAIWIPFIKDLYPDLLSQTYLLPPIYFNRTHQNVATIAGQTVLVRDNPSASGHNRHPPASPPAQVAGTVFADNSPFLQPFCFQESDLRDDLDQQRCLQALSDIPNQIMMVISSLKFQKYLRNHTNPLYAAAIAQLPTFQKQSIPPKVANGECDIVVIHRSYGLMILEIKSVGDNDFFRQQAPGNQCQIIVKQVKKALQQLENQERALRHLVSDLPPVRITKTLLLPNISSGQLQSVLSTSSAVLKTLCQTLCLSTDVKLAVSHCLCQGDLAQPVTWWHTLHTAGPDSSMTDDLYTRLVARFSGPATTVDIPTPSPPRKVVRSLGEAVAETGLRFSSLTLTPTQVDLLDIKPEPRYMFLVGPPGTGKTVVLLLKALQWARQGRQVVIVNGDRKGLAVAVLMEEQLRRLVGSAGGAVARVERHCEDLRDHGFNAQHAVSSLRHKIGPGPVLVVFDEVDNGYREEYVQWLTEVHTQLPAVSVWGAGVYKLDRGLTTPFPSWLEVQTLQEALRCPPVVTAQLQKSTAIRVNFIPQYSDPQFAVVTQGPPVQRLQHSDGQSGHEGEYPWQCDTCTDHVADVLIQLRVGQPGHSLQYRDVWILYSGGVPSPGDVMVERLQQRHRLPVGVVTSRLPSLADARELALAVSDQVMVAHWTAVQGLERRVVIVLGTQRYGRALHSQSRCSSCLHVIT